MSTTLFNTLSNIGWIDRTFDLEDTNDYPAISAELANSCVRCSNNNSKCYLLPEDSDENTYNDICPISYLLCRDVTAKDWEQALIKAKEDNYTNTYAVEPLPSKKSVEISTISLGTLAEALFQQCECQVNGESEYCLNELVGECPFDANCTNVTIEDWKKVILKSVLAFVKT